MISEAAPRAIAVLTTILTDSIVILVVDSLSDYNKSHGVSKIFKIVIMRSEEIVWQDDAPTA